MNRKVFLFTVVFILLSASIAVGQKPQRIRFAKGTHSGAVKGSVAGFAVKDYVVGAREGQTMTINLTSSKAYFVIYSINGRSNDMLETREWSDVLNESGDYVIRVFMMRNEARRKGAVASYTLKVSIQ
jgi:hypothetical protein